MVPRQTTPRTLYQPTARVWEGKEQPTQASLYRETTSYRPTTPHYLGASTPRTLFTRSTAEQPALQRAALARWQQQTPRSLLQQPTTRTSALGTRQFAQPAARTFATSPTEPPPTEEKSWRETFSDWFNPQPQASLTATYVFSDLDTTIKDLNRYSETSRKEKPQLLNSVIEAIKQVAQEYINLPAFPSPSLIKFKSDFNIANLTLLKRVIESSKKLMPSEQYQLVKEVLAKGANPNYNPHFTRRVKWYYPISVFEAYQYPPIWIAIMESNAGALKALLEANVKITNDSISSINNVYQQYQQYIKPYTTLLDIAREKNNPDIINILAEYGYFPTAAKASEQEPEKPQAEARAETIYSPSDKNINAINTILNDIIDRPDIQQYAMPQLFKTIDQFPQEYINNVYTLHGFADDSGKYEFKGKRFIDPILSNETLLKLAINKTNQLPFNQQYEITKRLLNKGANPTSNPQYTTLQVLNVLSDQPFNQQYQYSPVWIAIMRSNAGALKALLEANVKITNKTALQESKMPFIPHANLTLLEIAQKNNNREILNLLEQFGYIPRRKTPETSKPTEPKGPERKLSTKELIALREQPDGLKKMYNVVNSTNDPYDILGVSPDATRQEVVAARKQFAKAYFPDQFRDPEENKWATEIMQGTNNAADEILEKLAQEDKLD